MCVYVRTTSLNFYKSLIKFCNRYSATEGNWSLCSSLFRRLAHFLKFFPDHGSKDLPAFWGSRKLNQYNVAHSFLISPRAYQAWINLTWNWDCKNSPFTRPWTGSKPWDQISFRLLCVCFAKPHPESNLVFLASRVVGRDVHFDRVERTHQKEACFCLPIPNQGIIKSHMR